MEVFSRVDVPVGPCHSYADLLKEPQAWENGYLVKLQHPEYGNHVYPGCPVSFSQSAPCVQGAAARGAHGRRAA